MTRSPREKWTQDDAPYALAESQHVVWSMGANDRLTALGPLLDSHDALLADVIDAWNNGYDGGNTEQKIATADALTRGDTTPADDGYVEPWDEYG